MSATDTKPSNRVQKLGSNTNWKKSRHVPPAQAPSTATPQPHGMQKFIIPPRPGHNATAPSRPPPSMNSSQVRPTNQSQYRPGLRPPPPPSEPCPPNQPTMPIGGFRLPSITPTTNTGLRKFGGARENGNTGRAVTEILKTPNAGVAGATRNSLTNQRPVPGAGRPKPAAKPAPIYPKCRALYDYEARDLDEISIKEGDVIALMKESKSFGIGITVGSMYYRANIIIYR